MRHIVGGVSVPGAMTAGEEEKVVELHRFGVEVGKELGWA